MANSTMKTILSKSRNEEDRTKIVKKCNADDLKIIIRQFKANLQGNDIKGVRKSDAQRLLKCHDLIASIQSFSLKGKNKGHLVNHLNELLNYPPKYLKTIWNLQRKQPNKSVRLNKIID